MPALPTARTLATRCCPASSCWPGHWACTSSAWSSRTSAGSPCGSGHRPCRMTFRRPEPRSSNGVTVGGRAARPAPRGSALVLFGAAGLGHQALGQFSLLLRRELLQLVVQRPLVDGDV